MGYHLFVKPKKKYKLTYLQNKDRLTDTENKFMVPKKKTDRERIS